MITYLFKTDERVRMLENILEKYQFTVKDISTDSNVSKGLVSRYLDSMKKDGLLKRSGRTYQVKDQSYTRALKIILNLEKIKWDEISPKWITSAGLYGSWASGTNKEDSDLDIWIKVDQYPSEDDLNNLYKILKERTSSELNILILTTEKLDSLKENDVPFYNSLKEGSLILEGELIE
jgi:predicted nucleotidyltransferase